MLGLRALDRRRRGASFAFILVEYTKPPAPAYMAGYAKVSTAKFAPIEIIPTIHGHLLDVGENEDELRASWDFVCT